MIEKVSINEGTTIIVDSTAATEVAAVGIWYDFGSRDEDELFQGSTHFIEHMLFKGTSHRSPFQIAQGIDCLGGQINAATERECIYFFSSVPVESFEIATEILIDIINDASFKFDDFKKEKTVIENELIAAEDDPEEHAGEVFYERLWGDHPLSRKIGGSVSLLASLKYEDVLRLYNNQYRGRPALVTIAGNITMDRAVNLFSDAFKKPSEQIKRIKPKTPLLGAPYYQSASHQQIQMFCSFNHDSKISISDYYALLIANTALGDSMSSRLFQMLREKLGLCYNIYSMPSFFSDLTDWTIYASTTHDSVFQFFDALSNELHSIFDNGLTNNEIQDAKSHLIGSMKFDSIDMEHRMNRIARQWLSGFNQMSMRESLQLLEAMNKQSVNSVIRRFMYNGAILFGVGPARSKSAFCKAALNFDEIF